MKREPRFRAWDTRVKTMRPVYGLSFFDGTDEVQVDRHGTHDPIWYPAQDFALMQDTGLTDAMGLDIYEKDIVHGVWTEGLVCQWVEYQAPSFILRHRTPGGGVSKGWSTFDLAPPEKQLYRVVGNVFEHPHLVAS